MEQLGQTTRKVDKLRYLYETYILCILQDIIVQRTIFLHSLGTVSISKYTKCRRLNQRIDLFTSRKHFLRRYKDLSPFSFKGSRWKSRPKLTGQTCCLWSLNKISPIFASNSPGWGVYENRIVWSNTKAK